MHGTENKVCISKNVGFTVFVLMSVRFDLLSSVGGYVVVARFLLS